MEYKESLLINYQKLLAWLIDKSVVIDEFPYKITTTFPMEILYTQSQIQFYVVAFEMYERLGESKKSECYFLLYEPNGENIYGNFSSKDHFNPGRLFCASLSNGEISDPGLADSIIYAFFERAIEYKDKYNITPIFLSLLSPEHVSKIIDLAEKDRLSSL